MGVGLLLMVTVGGSGLVLLVLGLLLWQRRTVALRRITARTTGTVSGYDFRGDGRAHPQVDFVVPEIFPLGSSLEVHYNPEDPRKNFAVRDRDALAGPLLTWGGVGLLVLGVGLGLLIGLG